jgi:hypothetical protein
VIFSRNFFVAVLSPQSGVGCAVQFTAFDLKDHELRLRHFGGYTQR